MTSLLAGQPPDRCFFGVIVFAPGFGIMMEWDEEETEFKKGR